MHEKPVTFKSHRQQIIGVLHLPKPKASRVPAVVFFHGFRGQKNEHHRMFVKMARKLADVGIASLRFDFRGSGDSEGCFTDMTPCGEVDDAHKAVAYLRNRPEVDPRRIGIVAMSFGAAIASVALGDDPAIKAIVFWCPVAHPAALTEARVSALIKRQLRTNGWADMEGWAVGQAFVNEAVTLKPLESLARTEAPVLLIHGSADVDVPPTESRSYARVLRRAGCTVKTRIIKDAAHTFDSIAFETRLFRRTLDWFSEYL